MEGKQRAKRQQEASEAMLRNANVKLSRDGAKNPIASVLLRRCCCTQLARAVALMRANATHTCTWGDTRGANAKNQQATCVGLPGGSSRQEEGGGLTSKHEKATTDDDEGN